MKQNTCNLIPKKRKFPLWVNICIIAFIISVVVVIAFLLISRQEAKKALFNSIEYNDHETVEEILSRYPALADESLYPFIVPIDASQSSPLFHAIKYGDLEMIQLLVEKGANINKPVRDSYPLHKALCMGKYDEAWYLISRGADIHSLSGPWQESVLVCTLYYKIGEYDRKMEREQFEIFKYALQKGAPITPPIGSYDGIKTLLGLAAYQNNALVIEYLLDSSVYDIDSIANPTNTQKTALIIAVEQQSYRACETLLNNRANKDIKDADGHTAMYYAKQLNDKRLINMLSD